MRSQDTSASRALMCFSRQVRMSMDRKSRKRQKEAGVTPKEFVDKVAGIVRKNFDMMNTSYDYFVRTTDDYHEKQVQKIFKKLYEQGDIYKSTYEGLYCTPCESFWRKVSWLTENVRIAGVLWKKQVRKHTSSIFRNMHRVWSSILKTIRNLFSRNPERMRWSTTSWSRVCRICVYPVHPLNGDSCWFWPGTCCLCLDWCPKQLYYITGLWRWWKPWGSV